MRFSTEVGIASVRKARRAIADPLGDGSMAATTEPPTFPEWAERGGAFVTLRTYPTARLRGCVGYPRPVLPRGRAIEQAAIAAAFEDPRFPPLAGSELGELVVEVSLLSVPESIAAVDAEGRRAAVVVGRDGLIVSVEHASGLLLPQVAVEEGWDAERLLDGTCEKAGLPRTAWRHASTRIERFEAAVFAEVAPNGDVVRELAGPAERPNSRTPRRGAVAR